MIAFQFKNWIFTTSQPSTHKQNAAFSRAATTTEKCMKRDIKKSGLGVGLTAQKLKNVIFHNIPTFKTYAKKAISHAAATTDNV